MPLSVGGGGSGALTATRAAVLLVAATLFSACGNVVFHGIVARVGGVDNYGAIGSLLTLITVATFLLAGVQYAVARVVTVTGSTAIRPALALRALWPGLVITGILLAASVPMSGYLRLPTVVPVDVAALAFAGTLVYCVPAGVLVATQRWVALATLLAVQMPLRIAFLLLFRLGLAAPTAALMASLATVASAALVGWLLARHGAEHAGRPPSTRADTHRLAEKGLAAEGIIGTLLSVPIFAVWLLPTAFARHNLPSGAAGSFASAQFLASGVLLVTSPVATAFFPHIAARGDRGTIARGGLITCALGLAGTAVLAVGGGLVQRIVFGAAFGAGAELLAAVGISATAVALAVYGLWISRATGRLEVAFACGTLVAILVELSMGWSTSALLIAFSPAIATAAGGAVFFLVRSFEHGRRSLITAGGAGSA